MIPSVVYYWSIVLMALFPAAGDGGGKEGLSGLQNSLTNKWIGPLFLIVLAGLGVHALAKRSVRQGLVLIVAGVLTSLLIYGGQLMFGQGGHLTKAARRGAQQVNTIAVHNYSSGVHAVGSSLADIPTSFA